MRLQTSDKYSSAFTAATSIWKNEGPLAFYKGTLTPLLGIGACAQLSQPKFHQAATTARAYQSQGSASLARVDARAAREC